MEKNRLLRIILEHIYAVFRLRNSTHIYRSQTLHKALNQLGMMLKDIKYRVLVRAYCISRSVTQLLTICKIRKQKGVKSYQLGINALLFNLNILRRNKCQKLMNRSVPFFMVTHVNP